MKTSLVCSIAILLVPTMPICSFGSPAPQASTRRSAISETSRFARSSHHERIQNRSSDFTVSGSNLTGCLPPPDFTSAPNDCVKWYRGEFCPPDPDCDLCTYTYNSKKSPSCTSICMDSPIDILISPEANVGRVTLWLRRLVQEQIDEIHESSNATQTRLLNEANLPQSSLMLSNSQKLRTLVKGKPGLRYSNAFSCNSSATGTVQDNLSFPSSGALMSQASGPFVCNYRLRGVIRAPTKARIRIKVSDAYAKMVRRAMRKLRKISFWSQMFVTNKKLFSMKRTKNNKYFAAFIPFNAQYKNWYYRRCAL